MALTRLLKHALELGHIVGYAADLDLDVERFVRDVDDEELYARIRTDVASAEASGVRGTPPSSSTTAGISDPTTSTLSPPNWKPAAPRLPRSGPSAAACPGGRRVPKLPRTVARLAERAGKGGDGVSVRRLVVGERVG
jgi:hypothetical protein